MGGIVDELLGGGGLTVNVSRVDSFSLDDGAERVVSWRTSVLVDVVISCPTDHIELLVSHRIRKLQVLSFAVGDEVSVKMCVEGFTVEEICLGGIGTSSLVALGGDMSPVFGGVSQNLPVVIEDSSNRGSWLSVKVSVVDSKGLGVGGIVSNFCGVDLGPDLHAVPRGAGGSGVGCAGEADAESVVDKFAVE